MIIQDPKVYVDGVLARGRRLLAKTITLIESSHPAHQDLADIVLDKLLPYTGKAFRIGITGVPGVGKSTFIESFGMFLVKQQYQVAVLTVDPSSTRSGGSILADKTRMEQLAVEPDAFIRPSPAGETLGGVARKTRETMLLCEAAGFDVVIIETVGVGQSETTVSSMVDFFLVLMLAGAGDELQGIKKGVLELADAVAINKSDGDNIEKAERARQQYESALHFLKPATTVWTPPVLTCSALAMTGIKELWETIQHHRENFLKSGLFDKHRKKQALSWMWFLVDDGLKKRFYQNPKIKERLPAIQREVLSGKISSTLAARKLLFFLTSKE